MWNDIVIVVWNDYYGFFFKVGLKCCFVGGVKIVYVNECEYGG